MAYLCNRVAIIVAVMLMAHYRIFNGRMQPAYDRIFGGDSKSVITRPAGRVACDLIRLVMNMIINSASDLSTEKSTIVFGTENLQSCMFILGVMLW